MRQRFIVFIGSLLLAMGAAPHGFAAQNSGFALVIGNADYPDADAPLKEPISDARAIADELRHRGFDVSIGENLKKGAMQKSLDDFYGKVTSNATAVIFFSGFGIQSDRHSYLIPVDAQIWNESDVQRDGFDLEKILGEITRHAAAIKVAIVDASRKNPFEPRFRSLSAGLAPLTPPRGSAVMSGTQADVAVAISPPVFIPQLLAALNSSDATIQQIFNRTRVEVTRLTNGQQIPWLAFSLEADSPLGHPGASAPAVASAPPTPPPPATATAAPKLTPAPAPATPGTVATAAPEQPVSPPPSPPPPPAASPPAAATPANSTPATPDAPVDPEAPARHAFVLAEDAGTTQAWEDFLTKYPSGYYHDKAKQQLAKLVPPGPPALPPPAALPSPPASSPPPAPALAAPPVVATPPAPPPPSPQAAPSPAPPPSAVKTVTASGADNPTDLPGYYRRGQSRAINGDYDLAIQDFTEVVRRDPKHAGALNDRCWVEALVNELQDALRDCNAALQVAPKYPDALDSRGLVNLKLGILDKAIVDYNAALQLDSKHASALYGRGVAKRLTGDTAGSKSDIDAALAIQPGIADEFAGYGIK